MFVDIDIDCPERNIVMVTFCKSRPKILNLFGAIVMQKYTLERGLRANFVKIIKELNFRYKWPVLLATDGRQVKSGTVLATYFLL